MSKPVVRPQPKKHGYEFLGPPGALGMTFGLPALQYATQLLCNDVSGCPVPSLLSPSTLTIDKLKRDVNWQGLQTLFNVESLYATLGWYGLSMLLYAILPATESEGIELSAGGKLKYRFNAFSSALFISAILAAGTLAQGADFPVWTFISDNFIQLYTANLIVSFALAVFVYAKSFTVKLGNTDKRELAPGGITGNYLYDWFIGRELNPRVNIPLVGEVDIKIWMEMRPGLFGWILVDLAMVAQQYRTFGYVTASILITTVAQAVYVLDALYMEPAILTTIDIIADGFGFMLSFGDVAWVPFMYSIQTRYLAVYPVFVGKWIYLTIAAQAIGYYIFRSSNNEKNRFRTNPDDPAVAHLKYIETKAGSRLLVSGWWGTARHINYLGDWIMSWSYCLPTGLAGYQIIRHKIVPVTIPEGGKVMINQPGAVVSYQGDAAGWGMIVTYFFMLYFAVLLIHRERRDEEKCRAKYGKDWDEYCKKVPWRIIPYIY
ncbi:ERG4/ERG24 ergosterol biosynthesis protein [Microthyrium microscopicum]|uniref:Delta(14)-sterol reductase n=1 Tax=Microthyrium microscopicum TaxID=703497 RepID=A0A6A6TYV9_9PEZI|nr:ERG4/ERG24 ergosterol biosynthesis protein [Microthyrium microscopicum]